MAFLLLTLCLLPSIALKSACMGNNYVSFLTNAGIARGFGENSLGVLGVPNVTYQSPLTVPSNTMVNVAAISCGFKSVCFKLVNRSLFCTGSNQFHQISPSNESVISTPVWVADDIDEVKLGGAHTCFSRNQSLYCWGRGTEGQLGTGNNLSLSSPPTSPIPLGIPIKDFSLGGFHTSILTVTGKTKVMGSNLYGQASIGNNTGNNALIFQVPPYDSIIYADNPIKLSAGFNSNSWMFPYPGIDHIFSSSGSGFYNQIAYGNLINYGSNPSNTPGPAHSMLVEDIESYDSMTCIKQTLYNQTSYPYQAISCSGQNYWHEISNITGPWLNATPALIPFPALMNLTMVPGNVGSGQICSLGIPSYINTSVLYCQGDNVVPGTIPTLIATSCGNSIVEPDEGEECDPPSASMPGIEAEGGNVLCNDHCLLIPPLPLQCLPFSLSWQCIDGTWFTQGHLVINETMVIQSPVVIDGSLTLLDNASLIVNGNVWFNVSGHVILGGKVNISYLLTTKYLFISGSKINGTFTQVIVNSFATTCTLGLAVVVEDTDVYLALSPLCGKFETLVSIAVLVGIALTGFLGFLIWTLVMLYRKYMRRRVYRHIDSV